MFEVDRDFRAVTDATAAPQRQVAKRRAAETALREKLATRSVEEYLFEQNVTQAVQAALIPERTKRINCSLDFDL